MPAWLSRAALRDAAGHGAAVHDAASERRDGGDAERLGLQSGRWGLEGAERAHSRYATFCQPGPIMWLHAPEVAAHGMQLGLENGTRCIINNISAV